MLAVAFALLRDAWAALPRSLLLMEVTSLPAVPVADLLEEVLLWAARDSEAAALAVPAEDLRDVVEVPEALLPEAAALLRLTVDSAERRVVPDCCAGAALCLALELLFTVVEEDLLVLPDCCWAEERLPEDCTAEALLRETEPDWPDTLAALEREAADERETLEEDAELSREELTLVLEDLVAELPEEPVALRLACALSASGVKDIAIARTLTNRVLTKVFIRLIY